MVDESESSTIAFMREIFSYVSNSKTTYNLLESIHKSLKKVLYAENFFVVLMSGAERFVTFPYYQDVIDDLSAEELNLVPIERILKTLTHYAINKKKVVCLTRSEIEQLSVNGDVVVLGTLPEQWLCFPLQHQGSFLGSFVVQSYRSESEYSQHDINVLALISHVIAASLALFKRNSQLSDALNEVQVHKDQLQEKVKLRTLALEETLAKLQKEVSKGKELEQQLKFLAFHDNLTNLYDRNYFFDQMALLSSKSSREAVYATILFLDLDGFKRINDNYGHACGDYVLKVTAKRLTECFRHHDVVARFGGDEFVVLLTSKIVNDDLVNILQRIICSVSNEMSYQGNDVSVGVSIGISQAQCCKIDSKKLLEQADQALYQAKEKGKGCFVFN